MLSRLLCIVGVHRPALPGEWNLGYCFSTCTRCGRDMVRSVLDDEWKAPKSFRIVRDGSLVAYEDLDKFLRSRERPQRRARKIDTGGVFNRAGSSVAGERKRAAESPFDFSDFEPSAAGAPPQPPPPLKNVQNG